MERKKKEEKKGTVFISGWAMTGEARSKKVVGQLVEWAQRQEEEERISKEKKQKITDEIERKNGEMNNLNKEIAQLEAEIMSLRMRDKVYQKEHSNLRNSIAIIKFQIEKIKERIEETKMAELEDLKRFEGAVDEITQKFRSAPGVYDRRNLSRKLEEEGERKKLLLEKIEETREAYANFNREKGLRERTNEEEELLDCVLPGSELYYLMEMAKNLGEVICGMKEETKGMDGRESELKEMESAIISINSSLEGAKGETQIPGDKDIEEEC